MPLLQSPSAEALAENIRRLMAEGYPREQATAIALDVQRRARARARADNARAKRAAQMVAATRMLGRRRLRSRIRRLPRQVGVKALEREYARYLLGVVARVRSAMQPLFDRLPALLESAARDRDRFDEGEGAQVRALIEEIRQQLRGAFEPSAELQRLAARASTMNREQLLRQVRAVFGADVFINDAGLSAIVDAFASENVSLIGDVASRIVRDVEKATTRALASGTLHRDLAKELEGRFGMERNKAKLVARDQMGKLYGQVNAHRQQSIGVTKFKWRTVGDGRVRDEHRDREGVTYAYDDPPDGEIPGQPINCRCYAEPDFEDILAEMDA